MGEGDTIIEKLEFIRDEKLNKIIPENIKSGVNILNVDGALSPSEDLDAELTAQEQKLAELEAMVENKTGGAGGKPNIFVQLEEPTKKDGIWLQKEAEPEHYVYDGDVFVSGAWKPSGTYATIPYDFYNGSAVAIGTNIYIFGGSGDLTRAYKYDTLINSYTQLTNIPYSFYSGSAVAIGTNIYIFGGSSNMTYACKYDTLTNSYTRLTNIPYNFAQGSTVALGSNIYLFSSTFGGSKDVYKYDTLTDSYTRLSNIPYISGGGSATIIGTDIYIFGSNDSSCRYNAYKYNTLSDSYTRLADIPYAFTYGSVVALGSNIYLFGSSITTAGNKYAYKYNISTNTYTRLSNIPRNFYSGSAVLVKTAAFVLGGSPDKRGVSAFGLENTSYEADNLVVISQEKLGLGYQTELYNNPDDIMPAKYSFTDAWYYTLEGGLETDIPTYYGDGTQWIKFKN